MKNNVVFITFVSLFALSTVTASALAADSCQPVFDALTEVATTPNHSYTNTPVNGGKPAEAETIFANGQKYIRLRGRWMRLPVTSQDVLDLEKKKELHGKSTCQFLRNESMNGEPATVYSMHREYGEIIEDAQMWVSRGTGLLLRVEEDVEGNKGKEHRSTRFEYGNIRRPM